MHAYARYLAGALKPYRKTIAWCSALAVAVAGLNMLAPIALGRAVDAAREGGALAPALLGLAAWLGLQVLSAVLHNWLNRRGRMIAYTSVSGEKFRAVDELLRKPLSFHYGRKSGDVTEKLSKLEESTLGVIEGVIFDLVPAFLSVIAVLGYLATMDWRISLLLGATAFGLVGFKYAMLPTILPLQRAWRAASHEASSMAWDAIHNVLIVKSTGAEAAVSGRIAKGREKMLGLIAKDAAVDERMFNLENAIIYGGSALVLAVGLMNVRAGVFTFGQYTAVMAFTFNIFGYVRWFQWQIRGLMRASATYQDVRDLLDVPGEAYEGGRAIDLKGGIEMRGVRFRYRQDVPVIEDVSFVAKPGERIALVGESGEGKTTLMDLIGRYHLPESGTILYDGLDAAEVNLRSLRAQIGLVPQDQPLLHESIGENIRFGRLDATDEEVREAARLARLDDFIAGLPEKYATLVGERGLKLSGGQRQRVALARAFLRNPKILILDEPTSNLDSKTEEEIRASLETLMKGRTTFIIAHRLATVRDADRILVLKQGRIVEQGRHAELVAKGGAYAALLKAQGAWLSPAEPHLQDAPDA